MAARPGADRAVHHQHRLGRPGRPRPTAWPGSAPRPPRTSWSPRSRWLSGCSRRHRRRGCWPAAWPGRATASPTCWSPNPSYGATYDELDAAFRAVRARAELVATRSTGSPARDDGEHLDTGGWVRLLEYATGERARVLGKPSPEFFTAALDALSRGPETALVVGEDLEADIQQHEAVRRVEAA